MPAAPPNLPDDKDTLKALVAALMRERDDLHIENLRLQVELDGYKKRYYGPRADRLQSAGDLAQLLLSFSQELDRKPINPEDVPPHSEPQEELRRVKRRKGRRDLANFENLPVTTHVYELNAEQRSCPCCGVERKEIGAGGELADRAYSRATSSACIMCARSMPARRARPTAITRRWRPQPSRKRPIEKGMAGPGLLAYIITSKFAEYPRSIGWKTSSRGRASRSHGPRNRSGAAMWPTWSSPCIS